MYAVFCSDVKVCSHVRLSVYGWMSGIRGGGFSPLLASYSPCGLDLRSARTRRRRRRRRWPGEQSGSGDEGWNEGCCSTVSRCGRARRRAASAVLGGLGEVRRREMESVCACAATARASDKDSRGRVMQWRHRRVSHDSHLRSGTVKSLAVLCWPQHTVDDPADGAPFIAPQPAACLQLSAPAPSTGERISSVPGLPGCRSRHSPSVHLRARSSTGCCRLAAALRANPWSVGTWIVLRATSSLVHWCCSCPGQGRAANPWWLRRPGSSDLQNTSRHSDCPNSPRPCTSPALPLLNTLPSPVSCLQQLFWASASLRTLLTSPPADIEPFRHLRPRPLVLFLHTSGSPALESCLPIRPSAHRLSPRKPPASPPSAVFPPPKAASPCSPSRVLLTGPSTPRLHSTSLQL